jgi:hypothetical protein
MIVWAGYIWLTAKTSGGSFEHNIMNLVIPHKPINKFLGLVRNYQLVE